MQLTGRSDLIELGIAVRQRRLELGWTQQDVAKKADLNTSALSTFERYGAGVSLPQLARLLSVVGWTIEVTALDEAGVAHG